MTNILPPKEKEYLRLEQAKKIVIILGFAAIVSLICLLLILLSIKYYILSAAGSQKFILQESEKMYQASDFAEFKNMISKNNGILPDIYTFYEKEIYFSDILNVVSQVQRPEGLYFNKIYINGEAAGKIKVIVSGFSDTRENLLLFQKRMQEEPKIKNISFSPESWINPVNISFNLSFGY